jgi:hypothetical protein
MVIGRPGSGRFLARSGLGAAVLVLGVAPALGPGALARASVLKPELGRTAVVSPAGGSVTVRLPGARRSVALRAPRTIPMGSAVDATGGQVRLDTALDAHGGTQSGDFSSGAFTVSQRRSDALTTLRLVGRPQNCARRATTARSRRSPPRRPSPTGLISARIPGLKAHCKRRCHTQVCGKHACGISHHTIWQTTDLCNGTLIQVQTGVVVEKFHGETVTLRVGDSSLSYCSPSGDICTSVTTRRNDFTLGIGIAGGPLRDYRLCVTSPGGTTDCRLFRAAASKVPGFFISLISWRRNFAAHGAGVYTVRWIDPTPTFGGPLGPDLFFTVP